MKQSEFLTIFDPYSTPPSIIARLSSHFQTIVAGCIKPLGLIIPEWRILATLSNFGPCSVNDIVDGTKLPQSTVSRGILNLIKKDLITKRQLEKDNRYAVLEMTEQGINKCETAAREITKQSRKVLDELEANVMGFNAEIWLASAKAMNEYLRQKKK